MGNIRDLLEGFFRSFFFLPSYLIIVFGMFFGPEVANIFIFLIKNRRQLLSPYKIHLIIKKEGGKYTL